MYVSAIEHGEGKFAPAPKAWNQFMYSPLKFNEDLTPPLHTLHPLDTSLRFRMNANDQAWTYPYNNTITQVVKSGVFSEINSQGDTVSVLKPIVYTADAQVLHTKINRPDKKLQFYVKNNGDATLNAFIPVCLYQADNIPGGFIKSYPLGADVFVGDSLLIEYDLTDAELGNDVLTISAADAHLSPDSPDPVMTPYDDCHSADNGSAVGEFGFRMFNDTETE